MKKQIITAGLVLFTIAASAQEPPKPPTVEDRLKRTNELFQKEFSLNSAQQKAIEAAFQVFFTGEDQLRKDNPPPPPPPPNPKLKAAMDKLVNERDVQIMKVLSAEQFKQFKEAEKKMHPPPPPAAMQRQGAPPI